MVSKFLLGIAPLFNILILLSLSSEGSGSGSDSSFPLISKEWLDQVLPWKVQRFVLNSGSPPGVGLVGAHVAIQIRTSAAACPKSRSGGENANFCDRYLFLKTLVTDTSSSGWRSSLIFNFFWKEFKCYQILLPELERFQYTAGLNPGKIDPDNPHAVRQEATPPFIVDPLPFPRLICGNAVDFSAQNLSFASDFKNVRANPLENFIMLPDLRIEGGFKMLDRFTPTDFLHYQLVIQALSRLHAVSWAYKAKEINQDHFDPKGQNEVKGLLSKKFPFLKYAFRDMYQQTVQQPLEDIFKVFHQALGTLPHYSVEDREFKNNLSRSLERFKKLIPDILTLYFSNTKSVSDPNSVNKDSILRVPEQNATERDPASWDVLIHGDCSIGNWMFHYDERGRPDKVMLIDLQTAREGDPMTDLAYAWYMTTSSDFRTANDNANEKKLLEGYHRSFLAMCAQLQVDPPSQFTLNEVERRFHQAKIYGILVAVLSLPYRMNTNNNNKHNNYETAAMKKESLEPVDGTTEPFRGRAIDILTDGYHQGII